MVFVHVFGCDQQIWRFITPAFEDDYRIVLFDYVGHGGSDRGAYDPDRYATLDGFAQDVLDVVDALDLRDVILAGHSVGSFVGVLAVNRSPERFERLIMVAPRMEFGAGGEETLEGRPGDFLFVAPAAVHRKSNPSDEESHTVVVRSGLGAAVVNVDGPDAGS